MYRLARLPRLFLLVILVLGAAALPATSHAAQGFAPPVDVAGPIPTMALGSGSDGVPMALGPDGRWDALATASYRELLLSHAPGAAAATFTTTAIDPASTSGGRGAIHTDAAGNTVAAWERGGGSAVMASIRPAGGTWTTPVEVSDPANAYNALDPRAVITPQGRAVVVFYQGQDLMYASAQVGGSFGVASKITTVASIQITDMEVSPAGRVAVAFSGASTQVAELPVGASTWELTNSLTTQVQNDPGPQLAFDRQGNLFVAYHSLAPNGRWGVFARYRPAGAAWGGEFAVTPQPAGMYNVANETPVVTVDDAGRFTLAWRNYDAGRYADHYQIHAATWTVTGGVGAVATVGPGGGRTVIRPRIGTTAAGDTIAIWYDHGVTRVRGAVRVADGGWSAPFDVSGSITNQYGHEVATDPLGNAVVAWVNAGVISLSVRAGSPAVSGITVPPTANVDVPFTVAVVAGSSPWSDVAPTITWSVDGTVVGTGASRQLAIGAAGTHTVSVRIESAGATRTIERDVAVTVPGAPADGDLDGTPDATDCAPTDPARPARGVADANCNGVDDAVEQAQALEAAAQAAQAAVQAAQVAAQQALVQMVQQAVRQFTSWATQALRAAPRVVSATALQRRGAIAYRHRAIRPQRVLTQMSGAIAVGGGNAIAAGGGNAIAAGGGNIIGQAGTNAIAAGGGNAIAAGGGNAIAAGGGNLTARARATARPRFRQVLLATGARTFRASGTGVVRVRLTRQGKLVVGAYRRRAARLRAAGRPVRPLRLRITTLVGPVNARSTVPAVYSTRIITIRG